MPGPVNWIFPLPIHPGIVGCNLFKIFSFNRDGKKWFLRRCRVMKPDKSYSGPKFWIFFGVMAWIFVSTSLRSQDQAGKTNFPPPKVYSISPAGSTIKIDGVLNEPAWEKAVKLNVLYEWLPGDNIPAPVDTDVLVSYDEKKLYVGFRCFDPEPEKIRAHLMDRDATDTLIQDDHVSIMIDTFNDERRAFQFRVNPLGVQADANFSELEGYEDFSWDAIWESAGKITDFGYVVEIAIPFNQLRFAHGDQPQTWGFEADRSYPRNVRHRMSTHVRDRNRNCILCQFDKISGFKNLSSGHNLEFDPTLTLIRTDKREDFPDGDLETGGLDFKPGITARWGITPNLIFNAALNPDFSQVEADMAQLEVNTRFALRYPEKRPFFLEGADFFLTPLEAVFTRAVFDPLWGLKLTGKLGKNAIGVFAAQDEYNNLLFPSNQGSLSTSLEENVFSGVVRYRRDVGAGSTVGFLYTGRTGDDYHNHVAGVDGFLRLSRTDTLSFQFLHSETDYPETVSEEFNQKTGVFSGNAFRTELFHNSRNLIFMFRYFDLDADFRADYGFMPRVDYREVIGYISPVIWGKEGSWFNRLSFEFRGDVVMDQENQLTDQSATMVINYTGPLQTTVSPSIVMRKELFNEEMFDVVQPDLYFEIKPAGGLRIVLYSKFGDAIDYTNIRLATSTLFNPGVEFAVGKHVNINLSHIFERLSLEGEKIYLANLLQARLVYNFSTRSFVRAIVQYIDIDRNVDLYHMDIDARTSQFFTQFLFSYKINPQTVLFLGYSDNHFGMNGIDLTRTDRTFFLKIGYALVL